MEEAPMLRLEITQGPRAGEALVFKPGKKLGLGRIVRGNAVQIKDNGISSKHLIIEFVSGKWILTDLESSNGTIVNDVAIDPLVPTVLCDGDVVKIGEFTSINVKFEIVRVEAESVLVGESNLRRNPRRRAALKAVVSEGVDVVGLKQVRVKEVDVGGVDLEEIEEPIVQKMVRGGAARRNDDIADSLVVEESDVEVENRVVATGRRGGRSKRGRRCAVKTNDLSTVDDNVAEDSDWKVEKENRVVETGRRRGRPKKGNVVDGEAASVLAGKNCNEGQEVKKTRGGRGGGRKCQASKERNGEDESAFEDDKFTEAVATHVMEASHGVRGGFRNEQDLNKKSTEDESAMVDGNCDQPLQNVPTEDGIKKQTRGLRGRAQVVSKEVIKEVTSEKVITNSGSETQVDSVNIKKEKISICPSVVPENQMPQLESHMPLENLGAENESLEEAGIHLSIQEMEDVSKSHKEKEMNNSENEILPNTLNIKQEKRSLPPELCLKHNEAEFADNRCSENEESKNSTEPERLGSQSHKEKEIENSGNEILPNTLNIKQEKRSIPPELYLKHNEVNFANNRYSQNEESKNSTEPERLGSHTEGQHGLKLEEMTLGQWFDYLEFYLPKKIHDETEQMIASMIEKSKRYKEYVSQVQTEKGGVLPRQGS